MDIGNRIKELRIKNNLTLEDLASRSELSKGFLSQIERNLSSPSISTLEDIVEVLGVSLTDFFDEKEEKKYVYGINDYYVDEKDDSIINYLVPSGQMNRMEAILLELKKDGISQEIKTHEGEEIGYVIKGKILIENISTNEKYKVNKGETFYLKGEFKHRLVNIADDVSKIIWIANPSVF